MSLAQKRVYWRHPSQNFEPNGGKYSGKALKLNVCLFGSYFLAEPNFEPNASMKIEPRIL